MTSSHTQKLRTLRKIIGHNIRTRRLQRNMTLTKLSRLTNLNTHNLDMFEMGKAEISLNHIFVIATALNCDVPALLIRPTRYSQSQRYLHPLGAAE